MEYSPFKYGVTVSSNSFTNREIELERLISNLTNGINTIIISPRRWGKSSLVEKMSHKINRKYKNHKVIILDLFSTSNEIEFLELFAKNVIKASSNKWEDWTRDAKSILKSITPVISLGVEPQTDFSLTFNWVEKNKNIDEILNLPEKIAKSKKTKFIICIDEFQELANFSNYSLLEKKMRAIWQRQKNVSYCLFGSKRSMMNDIFDNPSKPFYRFGDIMLLPKIKKEKWIKFITKGFEQTKKKISIQLASQIAESMDNHSWYVQQLTHYVWQRTAKTVTKEIVDVATKELLAANSPYYINVLDNLSKTQINLLKAIVNKETQLSSKSTMDSYNLGSPNNVTKNKSKLEKEDIIFIDEGNFNFLDPALKLWFMEEYM